MHMYIYIYIYIYLYACAVCVCIQTYKHATAWIATTEGDLQTHSCSNSNHIVRS